MSGSVFKIRQLQGDIGIDLGYLHGYEEEEAGDPK